MKVKQTFAYCEYCNRAWVVTSPPITEKYENGIIEIRDGTILLPEKVAILNELSERFLSHSRDLSGIYCNRQCLNDHIKKILKIEV